MKRNWERSYSCLRQLGWGCQGWKVTKASGLPVSPGPGSSEFLDPLGHGEALLDEKSTEGRVAQPWWALRTWRASALTSQLAALLDSAEGMDVPSDVKTVPQGITTTYCLLGTHKSQALYPRLAGFYLYYCSTLTRSQQLSHSSQSSWVSLCEIHK